MAKFHMFGGADTTDWTELNSVAVIGLGRFGTAVAEELMVNGTAVLGIDAREDIVQAHGGLLTHVVAADSTKEETLRQLSIPGFDRVVVAIGSDVQASILTTSLLLKFEIRHVWAKAVGDAHGRILEQLGVKHVIYPEKDMGRRVAHLVRGTMQDYIDIGDDFALVKTVANLAVVGVPLGESKIRSRHGVTIAAYKPAGKAWQHAGVETVIEAGDLILVAGQTNRVEDFSRLR